MFDHHIQQCIGYTNYDMNNISKQTDRISNKVQFASQRAICSRHFFMAVFGCLLLTPCFFLPAFYVHASTMQTSGMTNNSDLNAKAAGLVGWWTMDGANMVSNVKDSSGNGNNGNLVGFGATSSAVVAGKIGQALKFNGSTSYVNVPTISIPSDITVSAWVFSQNFNQNGMIVEKEPVNTDWELFFDSNLEWRGGSANAPVSCSNPSNNKWHMISATQTGTSVRVYKDGVQCNSGSFTAIQNGATAIQIGRYNSGYYFNGSLDDIRIYNRALSAQEVAQLYNMGGSKMNVSTTANSNLSGTSTAVTGTGLVTWYTFDGKNMINNVTDSSGNGNNGNLVGFGATSSAVVAGRIGQALKFNGTNQLIRLKTGNGIPAYSSTTPYSVAFWVKSSVASSAIKMIYAENNPTSIFSLFTDTTSGKLTVYIRNVALVANLGFTDSTKKVVDGTWHHIVWTDSRGTAALYIDGVKDATNFNYTPNGAMGTTYPSLGGYTSDNIDAHSLDFFPGSVDDFRIYNRALSAQEIVQLYNMGQSKMNVSTTANSDLAAKNGGLVGWWTFDGKNMINNVTDSSGNGNNGNLVGFGATSSAVVAGKLGQGLKFNGSTSHINTSSSAFAFNFSNPFSISLWYKTQKVTGVANSFLGNMNGSLAGYVFGPKTASLCGSNDKLGFLIWSGNAVGITVCTPSNTIVPGNVWHHAVMTYNGNSHASGVHIYVDNVNQTLSTANDTASGSSVSASVLELGDDQTGDPFSGSMDDVRIYNRALSAQEVAQLYNMGK